MKRLEDTDSASTPEATKRLQDMRKILVGRLRDSKAAGLQLSFLGASLEPSRMDDQAAFLAPATPGQSRVSVGVAICHPFSQGSVRINSSETSRPPRIDPAYMIGPMDLETTSIGLRNAVEVMKTNPLGQKIKGRVFPAQNADWNDSEVRADYVRGHAGTKYHTVGTAALGSVVDGSLRVFSVDGLRVIDASVFPMHVSGNIQATVYAIAEKTADIIKEPSRER
jgi:choline dehydrogenase-like flavoprotein